VFLKTIGEELVGDPRLVRREREERGNPQGRIQVSDEREKRGPAETEDVEAHKLSSRMGEAEEKREKIAASDESDDVEAHRLSSRMGEAEEKREKIAASDEGDDVEGHMLGSKHSSGKMSS
jgi:hypothetical protein